MDATTPDEFLDLMAGKFRMLADPTRLAILRTLMRGERNVTRVVEETGRNQANVSKHLKMLAEAGLVGRRKEGLQVFYTLDDPLVEKLCKLVCETVVQEARKDVERKRKLLTGWGGKARRERPCRDVRGAGPTRRDTARVSRRIVSRGRRRPPGAPACPTGRSRTRSGSSGAPASVSGGAWRRPGRNSGRRASRPRPPRRFLLPSRNRSVPAPTVSALRANRAPKRPGWLRPRGRPETSKA